MNFCTQNKSSCFFLVTKLNCKLLCGKKTHPLYAMASAMQQFTLEDCKGGLFLPDLPFGLVIIVFV
jgi:hypothetical protein